MIYIWKDSVDEDTFHLGVRTFTSVYTCWCSLSIDALSDLFGQDFADWADELESSVPTEFELKASYVS